MTKKAGAVSPPDCISCEVKRNNKMPAICREICSVRLGLKDKLTEKKGPGRPRKKDD